MISLEILFQLLMIHAQISGPKAFRNDIANDLGGEFGTCGGFIDVFVATDKKSCRDEGEQNFGKVLHGEGLKFELRGFPFLKFKVKKRFVDLLKFEISKFLNLILN